MHARKIFGGKRLWLLGAVAAAALTAPASAQQAAVPGPWGEVVASARPIESATGTALLVPTSQELTLSLAPVLMPQTRRRSSNVALMVVGGAGLIVGSIIGGDTGTVVMVGSGIAGLIGLYRYLR